MRVKIIESLKYIGMLFEARAMKLYVVGGYVRNAVLNLPHSDIDLCGPETPQSIIAAFANSEVKVIPKAVEFGTVELHFELLGQKHAFEYTTFRSDTYGAGGTHRPTAVIFSYDLKSDAFRRDFSVNALYAEIPSGEIIDPTGGLEDLEHKTLRATNIDPAIILRDDGLRSLRLVRFACELGFTVNEETRACARRYAHLLFDIPVERIWQEMRKILMSDVRYSAPQPSGQVAHYRALKEIVSLDLLQYIFPELLEGDGVPQRADYHAYDVLNHSLHACEVCAPILSVRLASLLHDVAKPRCLAQNGAMLGHDDMGAQMAQQMLARLHCDNNTIERVSLLIKKHMLDLTGRAKYSTIRKHFLRMGVEITNEFILLREADFVGSGKLTPPIALAQRYREILRKMQESKVPFDMRDLAITGKDIMNELSLPASPIIGQVKHMLWLHCANHPADNNRARLLRLAWGVDVPAANFLGKKLDKSL